jgi:hypothetical protein
MLILNAKILIVVERLARIIFEGLLAKGAGILPWDPLELIALVLLVGHIGPRILKHAVVCAVLGWRQVISFEQDVSLYDLTHL